MGEKEKRIKRIKRSVGHKVEESLVSLSAFAFFLCLSNFASLSFASHHLLGTSQSSSDTSYLNSNPAA